MNTKEKILQAAQLLFSDKGVTGTSVRDIAQEAQVNVAAINYHFNSKENLFCEVLKSAHGATIDAISAFVRDKGEMKLEDFIPTLYETLDQLPINIGQGFKLVVLNNFDIANIHDVETEKGPPGTLFIHDYLKESYPNASQETLLSAARMILCQLNFSLIIHNNILNQSSELNAQFADKMRCQDLSSLGKSLDLLLKS